MEYHYLHNLLIEQEHTKETRQERAERLKDQFYSEPRRRLRIVGKTDKTKTGKTYLCCLLIIPKRYCDKLELKPHDSFNWKVTNFDPITFTLTKVEDGIEDGNSNRGKRPAK